MQDKILWAAFLFIAAAILICTNVGQELREKKFQKQRKQEQREQALGRKVGRIERSITSEKNLIKMTKTAPKSYTALILVSIIGGWVFGKLVFIDSTISLCLACVAIVLPHAYLILKDNKQTRAAAESLESAMRIITHEYISTLDLQKAVENSVDIIDHAKPFREFLIDCQMVSSNMERNLRRLEAKEDNIFFSRWVDQLVLIQSDRTQIVNLMPILDDMNDAKTAQRQNDTAVAGAWRDYFTMLFIILLSPLMIRIVQREWYSYLISTSFGRILIVAMLGALVWSTGKAMKINKPITG